MSDPVTTFYGRWARLYDLVARRTPGVASARAHAADALDVDAGDTVVEMGCGTGANVPYLCERVGRAGRVVGIDVTRRALDRARTRADRGGRENAHFLQADASRPPVSAADAVLATFVVGMFDDPAAVVEMWCDLVEPGGRVVLLDATRSDVPAAAPLNVVFGAFVRLTSPPGTKLRYAEPPVASLDRRVAASREAIATHGEVVLDERHLFGFLRLTVARV